MFQYMYDIHVLLVQCNPGVKSLGVALVERADVWLYICRNGFFY